MANHHLPFHQRIAGRLTLLGVIPAVLLLGIFTTIKIQGDYKTTQEVNPRQTKPNDMLGKLLMRLRDELRAEAAR